MLQISSGGRRNCLRRDYDKVVTSEESDHFAGEPSPERQRSAKQARLG
ncbi:hypothetical protein DSM3645_03553 [Blastopirellula marina DSM 3645]|uniref:Uncharacterized protein n=1 Tax=Blastopirellula marina DSM 3645 TaxID=314230 RepID=A3ZW24_9BACT|nr:hypothetical protein DSM3645_03553 [Blastopirellula marina DSM 3645]